MHMLHHMQHDRANFQYILHGTSSMCMGMYCTMEDVLKVCPVVGMSVLVPYSLHAH